MEGQNCGDRLLRLRAWSVIEDANGAASNQLPILSAFWSARVWRGPVSCHACTRRTGGGEEAVRQPVEADRVQEFDAPLHRAQVRDLVAMGVLRREAEAGSSRDVPGFQGD